ncbi:sigma factor-like helix-turn-helix DNA-binding protein [Streptomyces sp. NBC_01497]|uniref:sigma factor-like helix-turn-helix DNA-binding protein n=1 Tax=Streptomyces sp. NBC_01497 TaxID=2903885 RepID=UPI002E30BE8F|nr:sigma factor-like helix-turn-helix DNA-binding protein [Streptomyces sp. NBC_01497]
MRQRRTSQAQERRRAQEFESFVAGAAGRLLHTATLLTGEPPGAAPRALRLLTAALAATYADWPGLRGSDPYDRARQELAMRYARSAAWRGRHTRDGVLGVLGRQERLVLVLRLYEGADEGQTAALTGLPVERVRVLCARAVATLRARARAGGPATGGRALS